MGKGYRDEDTLRELYHGQGLTYYDIADKFGVAHSTIQRWIKKHGIESRGGGVEPSGDSDLYDNEEWLREQYVEKELSMNDMAEKAGTTATTIRNRMVEYGIERREPGGQKQRYATLRMMDTGHMSWESWTEDGGNKYMLVHRLLAVAEHGVDAVKDNHVHHENHIPWDNRPDNLDVLSVSDHRSYHAKEMELHKLGAEVNPRIDL